MNGPHVKKHLSAGKSAARDGAAPEPVRLRRRAVSQSLSGNAISVPSSSTCSPFFDEMNCLVQSRKQQGMGLIEILIAMLILGFGLLGVAGLQTSALRVNQDAWFVTQATLLSRQLIDDARARGGSLNDQGLADWQALLERALPKGQGAAEIVNGRITVSVTWLAAHYETADSDRYQTLKLGSGL